MEKPTEEQLAVALQQMTEDEQKSSSYCAPPSEISPTVIEGSERILEFVRANQAFAESTRDVSIGRY